MRRNHKSYGLHRDISLTGFFSLAFGSIIGVGWVTALGGWLNQAGPLGAIIAFLIGGTLMLFIGFCYAEVTSMLPLAGGEVAYSYKAFGTAKSFVVGWFLAFGYLSVSVFEAISIGKVLGYMFPEVDIWPIYSLANNTVYGTHLLISFVFTALITFINYVGVKYASNVQTILIFAFITVTLVFMGFAIFCGSPHNLFPLFSKSNWIGVAGGIGAVLVTVPFWFVGFDTIPQGAEEAKAGVNPKSLGLLILIAILGATAFYIFLIFSVSSAGPWKNVVDADLPTADAFELAFNSKFLVNLVLGAALIGLFTSWNGFFLAGSRVLYALGRGRIIPAWFGLTHDEYGTPANAIMFSGTICFIGALLGQGAMFSFINVASFCIAIAFLGVSSSSIQLRRAYPSMNRPYRMPGGSITAYIAAIGSVAILLAMLLPISPAALSWPIDWLILFSFMTLALLFWILSAGYRNSIQEGERESLILEEFSTKQ